MSQYHVTLNGQGYILDLARYQKRKRQPFATKQSDGAYGYADLAGPEQLFVISDWSGGEGIVQHDDAAAPARWRQGSGLDGYTAPGSLQLGPYADSIQQTTQNFYRGMASYAGKLYIGSATGRVYTWDGSTWADIGVVGGGTFTTCMAVFLNKLYVGNAGNGNLSRWDGTTLTNAVATAGGPIHALATFYRQTAQYLYVGAQGAGSGGVGRAYYWDGAALSLGQYDFEELTPRAAFVLGNRLYWAVADISSRLFGIYSVDDSGSGGVWRCHERVAGAVPSAGVAVVDDVAYIGDQFGGRIWSWDGSRLRLLRALAPPGGSYAGTLFGLTAWRGAVWAAIADGGAISLLRYDPAAGAGSASAAGAERAGWSRPVSGMVGTDAFAAATFNEQIYVGMSQTGAARVYRVQATAFGASGTLESGLIGFGLPGVAKLLRSVTVVTSALASGQSVQVEYRLEDAGAWTTLGTLATAGQTTATFAFASGTTGRQLALRLTLAGTGGAATTAIVYQLAVRYVPRPAVTREWALAVRLEGTTELPLVTLDGAAEALTGEQLAAALWTAAGTVGPLTFVDLDGASYSVYVDDVREDVAPLSQRRGYQRLGLLRLVEAA